MAQHREPYFPQVMLQNPTLRTQPQGVSAQALEQSLATAPHAKPMSFAPDKGAPPVLTIPPGSSLFDLITPPRNTTWQRENRRQGDGSLYSPELSPGRPYQFSMGAFEIPRNMGLFLTCWEMRIFTFSGVSALDTVEVAPGNLTTSLAFNFEVGNNKPFNSESEITPVIIAPEDQISQRFSDSASKYLAAAANNRTAASGSGKGLLPFDNRRPGSDVGPFSVFIDPQVGKFTVSAYVFEPLPIPVSFFQLRLAGFLTSQQEGQSVLEKIRST